MRLLMIFLSCLLFQLTLDAARPLSGEARISLLTAEPGEALYSRFGHSAVRVKDPVQDIDLVFNYGLFDFNTPNFYVKFTRGRLPYRLGIQSFADFLRDYQRENRLVYEQIIQLDSVDRQAVFDFLVENHKPENRYYAYDFFFDNCASRIRDVLEETLGDSLQYPPLQAPSPYTFRTMLDLYMEADPWVNFGMDLGLGLPADQPADLRGQMFIPEFLADNLGEAQLATPYNQRALLDDATVVLPSDRQEQAAFWLTPVRTFWLFLLLIVVLTFAAPVRLQQSIDATLFFLIGLAGVLLLFLWFGTDHRTTKDNLNVLWANPLFLLFPFLNKRGREKAFRILLWTTGSIIALILLTFPWFPQQLHPAIIPLLLALFLRIGFNLFRLRNKNIRSFASLR